MVEKIDIWRTANLLIQQHGEGAEWEAAHRADQAIEKGDPQGERVWIQVLEAVKSLFEVNPSGPVN